MVIVLDGVGVGELPDASAYHDVGANTLGNLSRVKSLHLPNLAAFGLGNIIEINGVPPSPVPQASYGKMTELSAGKDSTSGHWELMGLITKQPFPTYPKGFPADLLGEISRQIGHPLIGNEIASGTEIIQRLGLESYAKGAPIVYTSADSVFQIAAHTEAIPLPELYQICETARSLLTGEHAVGRVIARPFTGDIEHYERTPDRRDFSLRPGGPTFLDHANDAGISVIGIGKIDDLFAGVGISKALHSNGNTEGLELTLECIEKYAKEFIFTNLVDFDMQYGHRNDQAGFAKGLAEVDACLPKLMAALNHDDLLVVTADHGCDPTLESTDHTREYVPILAYSPSITAKNLGTRATFADLAQTLATFYGLQPLPHGKSFI